MAAPVLVLWALSLLAESPLLLHVGTEGDACGAGQGVLELAAGAAGSTAVAPPGSGAALSAVGAAGVGAPCVLDTVRVDALADAGANATVPVVLVDSTPPEALAYAAEAAELAAVQAAGRARLALFNAQTDSARDAVLCIYDGVSFAFSGIRRAARLSASQRVEAVDVDTPDAIALTADCGAGTGADGLCDYARNAASCDWDGGDCCLQTCIDECSTSTLWCKDPLHDSPAPLELSLVVALRSVGAANADSAEAICTSSVIVNEDRQTVSVASGSLTAVVASPGGALRSGTAFFPEDAPNPTAAPTAAPSAAPSAAPAGTPTRSPSSAPSEALSGAPSSAPFEALTPSAAPSAAQLRAPSAMPTRRPTRRPSASGSVLVPYFILFAFILAVTCSCWCVCNCCAIMENRRHGFLAGEFWHEWMPFGASVAHALDLTTSDDLHRAVRATPTVRCVRGVTVMEGAELAGLGECVICQLPFAEAGAAGEAGQAAMPPEEETKAAPAVLRLPCGHVFHEVCLEDWIHRQRTCPLCRADVPRPVFTVREIRRRARDVL